MSDAGRGPSREMEASLADRIQEGPRLECYDVAILACKPLPIAEAPCTYRQVPAP